mmetsp:Transcript_44309/g.105479  ORF Transcript_44309/g.105479 Transcript_44309/m.105479 type:complete len:303 (+) Transcript_44309:6684-7592(+)
MVHDLVICDGTAQGPHQCKSEKGLVDRLLLLCGEASQLFEGAVLAFILATFQQRIQQAGDRLHKAHVQNGAGKGKVLAELLDVALELVREEHVERALSHRIHLLPPAFHKGLPPHIGLVDVQHPATGHCGRACVLHILDLKQHPHRWGKGDALVAHQSEDLVVIHDSVHGLDPCCVDVTVQNHPLVFVRLFVAVELLAHATHDHRNSTIFPLSLLDGTIELISSDRLGVYLLPAAILAGGNEGHLQGAPNLGLPRTRGAYDEAAMPHLKDVQKVYDFVHKAWIWLQTSSLDGVLADSTEIEI